MNETALPFLLRMERDRLEGVSIRKIADLVAVAPDWVEWMG
ncbi:hypothetical protein [Nostoc sp. FACHB-145]|nr:hypothetical protein [Nostoc sp. FACHB-145]